MKKIVDIKKVLGNNIRKYRELRGFTQEQFIEKLGIGPSAISNIECGKHFPSTENLNKIINVLDIEPNELFINNTIENKTQVYKDFERRYNLIKKDKIKFEILYNVLKVLS